MIVSTKTSGAIIRRAFGKNYTTIISFDKMIEQFAIDPTTANPTRDVYILSTDDIMSNRQRQQFEDAAANKHVNVKIIFLNKTSKPMFPNGCTGVNDILLKPNIDQIRASLEKVLKGTEITQGENVSISNMDIEEIDRTKPSGEGYKLARTNGPGKPPRMARRSVTGKPIKYIMEKDMFITMAKNNDGFLSVANTGKFMPTYEDGSPIPVDEDGNVLDPKIATDEKGAPIYNTETGIVVMVDEIMDPAEAAESMMETAEDIVGSNVNDIKTVDQVMGESTGVDVGETIPMGEPPISEPEPEPIRKFGDLRSNIAERLNENEKVSDMNVMFREMRAAAVVKDLIQTSSTYQGIEEKLTAMRDAVYAVMTDKSYKTLEERWNKIHAINHDRVFYNATGNTLIEQRTTEIVDIIVTKSTEIIEQRLATIDKAIRNSYNAADIQDQPARLAALADEKASISAELYSLECDIRELMSTTDLFIVDVQDEIARRTQDVFGDSDLDLMFKAQGGELVDEASVTAIKNLLHLSGEVPDKFSELILKIETERRLLRKIYQIDEEIDEARRQTIERLRARSLEGKVVCQTMLKKSLNIFVGGDNVGKTIIPYLYTKYKSKQNCHVLCINICKNSKFDMYDIKPIDYDDFVTAPVLQDFTLVKGNIPDDVAAAQQFTTVLLKAVDYYKYVYIVMDDDQTNLFNIIAPDVYSVNYIVDTNPVHLESTKRFIDSVTLDNVAERIFINRCNISIRPILQKLGKLESLDYQICKVDEIPEITTAGLSGFDPYGISSVEFTFEEIHRHVKP